mmetsp:Transcript_150262/g.381927  ORF Transcript_150262/g.381927 Transcript_150262/m.381927 type:complete len:299 (-) Transcript_150262:941-1837(-)
MLLPPVLLAWALFDSCFTVNMPFTVRTLIGRGPLLAVQASPFRPVPLSLLPPSFAGSHKEEEMAFKSLFTWLLRHAMLYRRVASKSLWPSNCLCAHSRTQSQRSLKLFWNSFESPLNPTCISNPGGRSPSATSISLPPVPVHDATVLAVEMRCTAAGQSQQSMSRPSTFAGTLLWAPSAANGMAKPLPIWLVSAAAMAESASEGSSPEAPGEVPAPPADSEIRSLSLEPISFIRASISATDPPMFSNLLMQQVTLKSTSWIVNGFNPFAYVMIARRNSSQEIRPLLSKSMRPTSCVRL